MLSGILVLLSVGFLLSMIYFFLSHPIRNQYKDKVIYIIGGSEGIGKSLAKAFLQEGSKVVIFSRSEGKLEKAKDELIKMNTQYRNKISYFSLDVTKIESIHSAFTSAKQEIGDFDVLIVSSGVSKPGLVLQQNIADFQSQIDLNYLGAVNCIKSISNEILRSENKQIMLIGSACSVLSFVGYGSYAPSKFALKAFCDALNQELSFCSTTISLALPPDTKTPGFEEENKLKPKENLEVFGFLNESFEAEDVAKSIIDGLKRNEYLILGPDIGQNLITGHLAGLTERNRLAKHVVRKYKYWEKMK
eukprot:snap_masked-scaffold_27-processed-gene-4.2-mRNA-1 protein AED:0.30 eAED:0.30 QI:0/0/0/0.5/1/1/2/0/303